MATERWPSADGKAIRKVTMWTSALEADIAASPTLTAGSGAPSAAEADGSFYCRSDGAAATTLYARVSSAWVAFQDAAILASTANGEGASLIGLEDAAASLVAAEVEAAIAELGTPITLTAAAESGEVIAVTVAGPAHVGQYLAQLYNSNMLLEATAGDFALSETGAGAEVSGTGEPALLFTTSAAGAAVISVTDAGATTDQLYLTVTPMSAPAGAKAGPPAVISITFA